MILSAVAFSIALAGAQDAKPVTLNRVFAKGEKLQYAIMSNLHIESRSYGLATFMPEDLDLDYKFTTEVKELKADGVALLHYFRPNMVQVNGETAERPAKTTVEKVDYNFDLTVSPINKILEMKDLNPPKKKDPKKSGGDGDGDGDGLGYFAARSGLAQNPFQAFLGQFISDVYRLALNVGSMDSAIDFSPKLPLDDVKVGDTWKETVSYQPQALKGKSGKQDVQRLDYTFTYKGVVTVNGKQYHRINATLDLNTDLGAFLNQLADAKPEDTHIKSIPLNLKQNIDYDLDMATKRTVTARSKSEGGFKINITDIPDEPVQEQTLKGSTVMSLVSATTAAPAKVSSTGKASTKGGGKGKSH